MKVECRPVDGQRNVLTIYLDDEPFRQIDKSIFGRSPKLPQGCVDLAEFEKVFTELEYRLAKEYGLRSLTARNQVSTQLKSKFKQKKISPEVTLRLLQEFKLAGYLNDDEWVASFVSSQSKRHGPKAIVAKLRAKGMSEQVAERAVEALTAEDVVQQIQQLLKTKLKNRDLSDYRERQKVMGALMRKGFDLDQIREVLRETVEN